MRNPASAGSADGHGRQVSFILKKGKRKANYTDWMKTRVDSDYGKQVYAHRMSVVEPVFGNIGTNKKLNRFSLRGKDKVQGQWQRQHDKGKRTRYDHSASFNVKKYLAARRFEYE